MKSTIDTEDDDKRRNTKKNIKLKKDVMPWKKEKNKNYKQKKGKNQTSKDWESNIYEDIKFK